VTDAAGPVLTDPLRTSLESALTAQYDVVRLLGRGGMGAVYLARDRTLERVVAIKVLPPEASATADAIERFKREARTVAALSHQNIVPLYAFGQAGQLIYYVMGYVRGESLGERMSREGRLPPDEARRILTDLADALDYAHRQGVVHRDIKPDNILLDDATGRPMLTDFGIARVQVRGQTLTQVGAVVGTPDYMSPEQASGDRELDGRSDIYSLGVVGYAMLTGRVPFEGKNVHEILFHHVATEAPSVKAHAPDTPDDLAEALARAMKKDPAQRWPDGKSLRQALGADLSAGGEAALPPELRELIGMGLVVVLAAFASALLFASALVRGFRLGVLSGWWSFYPLIATMIALVGTRQARRSGYDWAQIRRVMLWQPRWWPFWWAPAHRRPGDVTSRLPRALRRLRVMFNVAVIVAVGVELVTLPFFSPLLDTPRRHAPPPFAAGSFAWLAALGAQVVVYPMLACVGAGVALMLGSLAAGIVWGTRTFGLGWHFAMRTVGAPALSPFWSRAQVAPLLVGRRKRQNRPRGADVRARLSPLGRHAGRAAHGPRAPRGERSALGSPRAGGGTGRAWRGDRRACRAGRRGGARARGGAPRRDRRAGRRDERAAGDADAPRGAARAVAARPGTPRRRGRAAAPTPRDAAYALVAARRCARAAGARGRRSRRRHGPSERDCGASEGADRPLRVQQTRLDVGGWGPMRAPRIVLAMAIFWPLSVNAQQPLDHARDLLARGAVDDAVRVLEAAMRGGERSAASHVWLATAYSDQAANASFLRQIVLARRVHSELERAVALDPASVDARSELARWYLTAPAVVGGSLPRAEAEATALAAGSRTRSLELLGWIAHHRGDVRAAERDFRAAIDAAPDSATPYFSLAHLMHDEERNDEAVDLYAHGLALRPEYRPASYELGVIGAATGTHLAAAARALERYLADPPPRDVAALARAHWQLGIVYEKQGRLEEARREYAAAMKLRPGNRDYAAALARSR
jgi:tetratricopeptide (TPR) repeat protein/predicted Ser/Thr protein kinase